MKNRLYKIGLIAGLVSAFTLGPLNPTYSKDKPKKNSRSERFSSLEDVCQVPEKVRKFRKDLDQGPEGRSYVLVELAPGMKRYILTDKDGSLIRSFAKHKSHMNEDEIKKFVYKTPEKGHKNYLSYAFNCSRFSNLYRRISKKLNELDKNHNLVIEPGEL